jgi:hypothetical protein
MKYMLFVLFAAMLIAVGCVKEAVEQPIITPPVQEPTTPEQTQAQPPAEVPATNETTTTQETTTPVSIAPDSGRVVFTITDAAPNMGEISGIVVTIDNVSVHRNAGAWVDISSAQQSFDLLQLNAEGVNAILADTSLEQGIYYELRLGISKVEVTDANGTHEAKLPSGVLKIVARLAVSTNQTSTAIFDFNANESLHMTGNGEYILAPVIKLETRSNAMVNVSNKHADISGGKVDTSETFGMNENGFVGVGIKISQNAKLSIQNGKIKKN